MVVTFFLAAILCPELLSESLFDKLANGGGVEYVPVSQKISKKEKDEFLEYIDGFYGKKGIYADDLKGGFSKVELRVKMLFYYPSYSTNL
jgi:hypothetical protein